MKKNNIKELEITKEMYNRAKEIENLFQKTKKLDCRTEKFKKLSNTWIKLEDKFAEEFSDEFDTLEIVNEYERRKREKEKVKKMEDEIMLNYYDEMKNDIMEALKYDYAEVLENAENKEDAYYQLEDIFFVTDSITGNASGSYYFNSYKSRKHCYNFFRDVFEALEEYGYKKELKLFKTFVTLVEENYLNIENMTLNDDILEEMDEDEKYCTFYAFEEIEELSFETLDVITRCYYLSSVLWDVLDNYLD